MNVTEFGEELCKQPGIYCPQHPNSKNAVFAATGAALGPGGGIGGAPGARGVPRPPRWTGRDPNFRKNLENHIGPPPPGDYHAHHVLPVEYGRDFARLGINANDPKYGSWVSEPQHIGFSSEYSKDWAAFLRGGPTRDQALDFARMMGGKYGFQVHF